MNKKELFLVCIGCFFTSVSSMAEPPPRYIAQQKEEAPLIIKGVVVGHEIIEKIKCTETAPESLCTANALHVSEVDGQVGFITIDIKQVMRANSNLKYLKIGNHIKMKYDISPAFTIGRSRNSRLILGLTSNDLATFYLNHNEEKGYFESVTQDSVMIEK